MIGMWKICLQQGVKPGVARPQPVATYKTMRGGGYTSQGVDLRITNRSFIVPDFRDETIGFRCASQNKDTESRKFCPLDCGRLSKKIKIVEDEKHGKQNIDNHSSQNYNVEHFCIAAHGLYLLLRMQ